MGLRKTVYIVWSMEHQAWHRPLRMGYTADVREAGRMWHDQAVDIAIDGAMSGVVDRCDVIVAAPDNWDPQCSCERYIMHGVYRHKLTCPQNQEA